MGHALARIVDHDRKVIARRRLLARQHDVAPYLRICRDRSGFIPGPGLDPRQRSGSCDPRRHAPPALGGRERTRVAGVERRAVGIARPGRMHLALGDEARDLAAALEARIEESIEPRERRAIVVEMRALAAHGLLPSDAEPRQVFIDRGFVLRPAARRVDVLDAQQEPAAGRARHLEIDERGERMADMQVAVRARSEAEDGSAHARAGRPCPRKGLRRDGICRCFAAVMSFFIHTEADLDHAIARLVDADPRFGIVLSRAGRPPLRRRPDGFSGLASIVVSQQLSTASAKAIWARLTEAFDPFDHAAVLRARSPKLARAGLSAPKIRTLKAIAKAVDRGELDLPALVKKPADEAHAALTAVHGIGPWTADIYLLFCLGHADAWPAGDLALQEATRLLLALKTRPTSKEMGPLAELWRPWRGAPARSVPARLRRRRQRPHRYRPGVAGAVAPGSLRLPACPGALRPGAGRPAMVPAHLPRSQ